MRYVLLASLAFAGCAIEGPKASSRPDHQAIRNEAPPWCPEPDPRDQAGWPGYVRTIHWEKDLERAAARAREESRLVFWYQLVGNLDDAVC